MRRLAVVTVALGLALTGSVALAQEPQGGEKKAGVEKHESFAEKHELELKWANFLLLAGVLGYFIGKSAGPFFAGRSAGIRKDMDESLRQRQEAEAKAAEVDRRLANLEKDIAALRGQGEAEGKAETERLAQHTEAEIAKIQAHAEREIASAGKAARMALKRYSAELAMGLAEQKVRARMTPDTEDALVQGFVRNLKP
ncbi:MAG: ATP synthase F0 subunit B [Candidatus Solibacter sp.]|jgi:F-type H+-transporting ATPase subunit b